MRAAVIFGLGSSEEDLETFRKNSQAEWSIGLPASSSAVDGIVIFGGDGTVHRHLPDLVRLQLPLLVVPCGSGNDFARALGLRKVRDSLNAWQTFSASKRNLRTIDLGVITPIPPASIGVAESQSGAAISQRQRPSATQVHNAGEAPAPHYFCCVGGIGLDAEVARRANRLPRRLRGHGGYVLSVLPALSGFKPLAIKISSADAKRSGSFLLRSDQPTFLAAFANTQAYGDGMRIAPRARMDDGFLDVCVIREIAKFKLFCMFPTVYFGRHLQMPEVEYFQSGQLRIETDKPAPVYADGEYVCETPIDVTVAKAALRVIISPPNPSAGW